MGLLNRSTETNESLTRLAATSYPNPLPDRAVAQEVGVADGHGDGVDVRAAEVRQVQPVLRWDIRNILIRCVDPDLEVVSHVSENWTTVKAVRVTDCKKQENVKMENSSSLE